MYASVMLGFVFPYQAIFSNQQTITFIAVHLT